MTLPIGQLARRIAYLFRKNPQAVQSAIRVSDVRAGHLTAAVAANQAISRETVQASAGRIDVDSDRLSQAETLTRTLRSLLDDVNHPHAR